MHQVTRVHPPDKKVLDNVTLAFLPGAKIGVIGANGSGKSTLMRIMAGIDDGFTGEAQPHPSIRVGYFAQEPDLGNVVTVREAVELAVADTRKLLTDFEDISAKFAEPMSDDAMNALLEKQGKLQDRIDAIDAWNLDQRVERAMDALRLPPGDAEVNVLSGGEKRRVALCRILLENPDMLLLDEPMAGMAQEDVERTSALIKRVSANRTILMVEHNLSVVSSLSDTITVLARGRVLAEGNYEVVSKDPRVIEAYIGAAHG